MGRVLAERTHCYRGHAWTEDNTVWVKDKRKPTGKRRQCRACKNTIHRVWSRANSFKKRGEKVPDGLLESIFQEGVRRPDKTKIIQIRAHLAHSTDHLNKAFKLLSEVEKRAT